MEATMTAEGWHKAPASVRAAALEEARSPSKREITADSSEPEQLQPKDIAAQLRAAPPLEFPVTADTVQLQARPPSGEFKAVPPAKPPRLAATLAKQKGIDQPDVSPGLVKSDLVQVPVSDMISLTETSISASRDSPMETHIDGPEVTPSPPQPSILQQISSLQESPRLGKMEDYGVVPMEQMISLDQQQQELLDDAQKNIEVDISYQKDEVIPLIEQDNEDASLDVKDGVEPYPVVGQSPDTELKLPEHKIEQPKEEIQLPYAEHKIEHPPEELLVKTPDVHTEIIEDQSLGAKLSEVSISETVTQSAPPAESPKQEMPEELPSDDFHVSPDAIMMIGEDGELFAVGTEGIETPPTLQTNIPDTSQQVPYQETETLQSAQVPTDQVKTNIIESDISKDTSVAPKLPDLTLSMEESSVLTSAILEKEESSQEGPLTDTTMETLSLESQPSQLSLSKDIEMDISISPKQETFPERVTETQPIEITDKSDAKPEEQLPPVQEPPKTELIKDTNIMEQMADDILAKQPEYLQDKEQATEVRDSSEEREPHPSVLQEEVLPPVEPPVARSRDSSAERDPTEGFDQPITSPAEYTGIEKAQDDLEPMPHESSVERYPTGETFIAQDSKPSTGVQIIHSRDSSEERDHVTIQQETLDVKDIPAVEEIPTIEEFAAAGETAAEKEIPDAIEESSVKEIPATEETPLAREIPATEETPAVKEISADKETLVDKDIPAVEETPDVKDAPVSEKIAVAPLAMLLKTMWDVESTGDEPTVDDTEKPKYAKENLELKKKKMKKQTEESPIQVEEVMQVHTEPEQAQMSEQELKIAEMRRQKRKRLADEPTKQLKSVGEGLESLLLQAVWGETQDQEGVPTSAVGEITQETDLMEKLSRDSSEEREPLSKPYEVTFPPDQETVTKESRDSSAERDPTSGFDEPVTTGTEYAGVEIVELTEEQKQSIRETSVDKYPTDESFISDDREPVLSTEPLRSRDSSEERDTIKDTKAPEDVQRDSSEEREPVSSTPYEVTFPAEEGMEPPVTGSRDSSAERDPTTGFEEPITTGDEYTGIEITELTEEEKQAIRESSVEKYPTDEKFISDDKEPTVGIEPAKSRDSSEERDPTSEEKTTEVHDEKDRDSSEEREPIQKPYEVTFPPEQEIPTEETPATESRDSSAERDPTTGFEEPVTTGTEYAGVEIVELTEAEKQAVRESSVEKYPTDEQFISEDKEPAVRVEPTKSRDSSEERDPTATEDTPQIQEERDRDSSEEREPVPKPYEVPASAEEAGTEPKGAESRDSSAERDPTSGFEEAVTTGSEYTGSVMELTEEEKQSIRESSVEKYPTDEEFISDDKEPILSVQPTKSRDSSEERDPTSTEEAAKVPEERDSSEEREPVSRPLDVTDTTEQVTEPTASESRDSSAERDPTTGFEEPITTGAEYTGDVVEMTEEQKLSIRETSLEKYPTDEDFISDDKEAVIDQKSPKSRDSSEERDPTDIAVTNGLTQDTPSDDKGKCSLNQLRC